MSNPLRALWREPRIHDAPGPKWDDWLLLATLVLLALAEGLWRSDLVWPLFSAALTTCLAFTLPWRRVLPAPMLLIAFGANAIVQCYTIFNGIDWDGTYTGVFLLLLPYALLRWGSGRQACAGLGFIGLTFATTIVLERPPWTEIIGASLFILFPSALGASIRFQNAAQRRANEQVRMREREQLARELHDTVGHYVSAIAIQAQAGRAMAASRPEAPLEALKVIEEAASTTLSEMRHLVRAMRGEEQVDFAPALSVADIERLTQDSHYPFDIDLQLTGDLSGIDATLASTLFRITQESITNTVRHARDTRNLSVRISADTKHVYVKINDDGAHVHRHVLPGLGIQGMTERVTLLGGTISAGPDAEQGWCVEATLPRTGKIS